MRNLIEIKDGFFINFDAIVAVLEGPPEDSEDTSRRIYFFNEHYTARKGEILVWFSLQGKPATFYDHDVLLIKARLDECRR